MEIPKIRLNYQLLIAALLVAVGIGLRLVPHIPNFAPVAAIALFAGALLGWRMAIWLSLIIMAVSDLFIGFYSGFYFTWIGFLLIAVFGVSLRNSHFLTRVSAGAVGGGMIFYLVSNFGVWLTSTMYPLTFAGLLQSYAMGIPFFRTSLLANLFYAAVLFGSYEVVRYMVVHRRKSVALQTPLVHS